MAPTNIFCRTNSVGWLASRFNIITQQHQRAQRQLVGDRVFLNFAGIGVNGMNHCIYARHRTDRGR